MIVSFVYLFLLNAGKKWKLFSGQIEHLRSVEAKDKPKTWKHGFIQ